LRALLLALTLLAAAPPPPSPPVPGLESDDVVTVYQWIQLLPAPPTPAGWQPANPQLSVPLERYRETQPFGCTGYYLEKGTTACPGGFHTGIDLADPTGTPILAAGPGLAYPFQDALRYGNHVIVMHAGGYATVYGHMVRTAVGWGEAVVAGQVIGFVGSTGNSSGPHLHFEVRLAGQALDPMPYLTGDPAQPFPLPAGWQGAPPDDPSGPG
jgi:murein DD-endopeptidase MepM/ murein hydrolase activator NlpD